MIHHADLAGRFALAAPATEVQIAAVGDNFPLPPDYVALLRSSNGLATTGCLTLLSVEEIAARNADYAVQATLPDYVMIGDDSGGQAVLMRHDGPALYSVGMGVMDATFVRPLAPSLETLLVDWDGILPWEDDSIL